MKIPETSANVGAYYGNEENGQWQPNGVIIDSGVGGGVVGSGDAGIHRPPVYPVHLPRPQVPAGYVMAGAFYPPGAYPAVPPAPQDNFEDYMWMENEEEFDKQVMQQLEEEALMEQCIEAMLEDEQRERNSRPVANGHNKHLPTTSNGAPSLSLEEAVSRSTLNPLAAEFVPTRARPTPAHTEEKPEPPEPPASEAPPKEVETTPAPVESRAETTEESKTEEPVPSQQEPPEVSAADVLPITDKTQDKRPKDPKKDSRPKQEVKKPVKNVPVEVKPKPKPQVIKSETKVQPKKKEVKSVKSEGKVEEQRPEVPEEKSEVVQQVVTEAPKVVEKAQSPPVEDSTGPKPINYAAAAKANKPKKPVTPPASDKSTPPPQMPPAKPKVVEKIKKPEKPPVKTEKVIAPRKNSMK